MRAFYLKVLKAFPTLLVPRNSGPWQIRTSDPSQPSEVIEVSEVSEVSEVGETSLRVKEQRSII